MGGCCSSTGTDTASSASSVEASDLVKGKAVLLLGTGGAGKSTMVKTMRELQGMEDSHRETQELIYRIRVSMIRTMSRLAKMADELYDENPAKYAKCEMDSGDEKINESRECLRTVPSETESSGDFLASYCGALMTLWECEAIEATFALRHTRFAMADNMAHFYGRIDSIFAPGYSPTRDDALMCSVPSCGIVERTFSRESSVIRLIDMGGRRNERKNWSKKFYNVFGVIYVVSLTDYRSVLLEDDSRNAMHESLDVFASTASFEALDHAPFFVVLNKVNLFKEALKSVSLEECFSSDVGWTKENEQWTGPEYDSQSSNLDSVFKHSIEFIEKAYERRKGRHSSITIVRMSAFNSDQVQSLLDDVCKAVSHTKLPQQLV